MSGQQPAVADPRTADAEVKAALALVQGAIKRQEEIEAKEAEKAEKAAREDAAPDATTDAAAATDDSTTTAADTTSNLLGLWIALGVVGGLLLSLVVWVVVRKSRSSSSAP